jgi:PST family polysaccharide transporter
MGTDFYPRLTAAAHDESECNRLVNEQTQIGMLLGGPGVLTTLAFTPLVITLLYSSAFQAAVEPLRWICLGMMLRVVTWPLGFVLVAKGMRLTFVAVDLAYAAVHVGLAWLLVPRFGVTGAGIAFFGSYLFHALVVYPVVRFVTGFRYSSANRRLLPGFVGLIAVAFALLSVAPGPWATAAAAAVAIGSGVYSLHALVRLVPPEQSPPIVRRVLTRLRLYSA